MKISIKGNYSKERKERYPSIGEQLDALWKLVSHLQQTPESQAILDEIKRIKEAYPKDGNK